MGDLGLQSSSHVNFESCPGEGVLQAVKRGPGDPNPHHMPRIVGIPLLLADKLEPSQDKLEQRVGPVNPNPPHHPPPPSISVDELVRLNITSLAQVFIEPERSSESPQLQDVLLAIYENKHLVYQSGSRVGSDRFDLNVKTAFALDKKGVESANSYFKPGNSIAIYTRFGDNKSHFLAFAVGKLPDR